MIFQDNLTSCNMGKNDPMSLLVKMDKMVLNKIYEEIVYVVLNLT